MTKKGGRMSEVNFELRGWKALIVIPIILGLLVFQHFRLKANLDEKAREPIKQHLLSTYSGQLGHDLSKIDPEKVTTVQGQQILEKARKLQKIEITSLKAKRKGSKKFIVRAEYTLDGKLAPDGKNVRYFLVKKGLIGDWRVEYETSGISYHLTLW